jgi:hypothetical protein
MSELLQAVSHYLNENSLFCAEFRYDRVFIETKSQVWLGRIEMDEDDGLIILRGTYKERSRTGDMVRLPDDEFLKVDLAEPNSFDRILAWANSL